MAVPHLGPIAGVIVIGLLLGGCGGNKACRSSTVYKEGDNVPDIRIPDGLSQPDTSEALPIPVPSASAALMPSTSTDAADAARILFIVVPL